MNRLHRLLGMTAAALGLGALAADFRPVLNVAELATEIEAERHHISALELADRIVARDQNLQIFDLRPRADYEEFHIPGAKHTTLTAITHERISRNSSVVFYSEGGAHSAQAWVLIRMRGYRNVFILREGIYEWISRVREPRLAIDATAAERAEFKHAAELSRFFGGVPLADVTRAEVPAGYWTNSPSQPVTGSTQQAVAKIRRRGC
jgi:sulfur-carrier protein adenylyltransferase/sulfurtransferase